MADPARADEPDDPAVPPSLGPLTDEERRQRHRAEPPRGASTRQLISILMAFAVVGSVLGWVWQWWWTPTTGTVIDQTWLRDEIALAGDFSGTGLYVLLAVGGGLVLGVLVAAAYPRTEWLTLAAVLVGSALAALVMYQVGTRLGPPDPQLLAARAEDGTQLPGNLQVAGLSPFGAFTTGALLGLVVVYLSRLRERRYQH